jgi:hypothetical protein
VRLRAHLLRSCASRAEDASASIVTCDITDGLQRVLPGAETRFSIRFRNRRGPFAPPASAVSVSVRPDDDGASATHIPAVVSRRPDGDFDVSFLATAAHLKGALDKGRASVLVRIKVHGEDVARSPLSVPVVHFRGILAGKLGSRGDGPGQFARPCCVAAAPDGTVFVGDESRNLQMFRPDGSFVKSFGSGGRGPGQFLFPSSLVVHNGELFVCDAGACRVHVFSLSGVFKRMLCPWARDSPQMRTRQWGIAVGPTGEVFVTHQVLHKVVVLAPNGSLLREFGTRGTENGQLQLPHGICLATDELLVADCCNNRIQVFTLEGTFKRKFGAAGTAPGQFSNPCDVAVSCGDVFVVDMGGHRLQQFDLQGSFKRIVGSGKCGDGDTDLHSPMAVAAGPAGEVLVADTDNQRVVVYH